MNKFLFLLASPFALVGCETVEPSVTPSPQDSFWQSLSSHCGNAYAGRLVSDDAADADMRGAAMVMHVRECSDRRLAIPFHIKQRGGDWNRSRTWVLTRTDTGLRLKHDHRHEDGEPDAVTMYGGDTTDPGSPTRQSFPVDTESIALFRQEELDASLTNIWRIAVDPANELDAQFTYSLERTEAAGAPEDRDFRVTFDLTRPVAPPPAPWGF